MIVHALAARTFHERPERKLIELASPIFDPAKARFLPAGIRDRDLRNQDWLVAERGKNDLVDHVAFVIDLLSKISLTKYSFEVLCIPRIVGAKRGLAVGQVPEAAREPAMNILEAALSRCALVLNDIPSLRELWGNAALYFQTNDPESLADTIRIFSDDPQLRRNFANRAFQRARECFNAHRMTDSYVQLYHSVIAKKAAAA